MHKRRKDEFVRVEKKQEVWQQLSNINLHHSNEALASKCREAREQRSTPSHAPVGRAQTRPLWPPAHLNMSASKEIQNGLRAH